MRRPEWVWSLTMPSKCASLEPVVSGIALVLPIARSRDNVCNAQTRQVFGLLVADLRRHAQPEGRAVLPRERLVIHFVTQQRLRMEHGSHVERLVVIVGALDIEEFCIWICADLLKKVRDTRSAKSPNNVPAFNAKVLSILR